MVFRVKHYTGTGWLKDKYIENTSRRDRKVIGSHFNGCERNIYPHDQRSNCTISNKENISWTGTYRTFVSLPDFIISARMISGRLSAVPTAGELQAGTGRQAVL